MWNDTDLQRDVETELRWELNAGLKHISVAVKGGAVELAGHVDTYWEKCAAERAAWRIAHVSHVANSLRVVVPFPEQRADDDIALAAMTILEWNCLVPPTVEVEVSEGRLTLSGAVERQQQKQEAERALAALKGITGIDNQIAVQPAATPADAKAPIEAALKRNALVDSAHIKVQLAHGVIGLRGIARSRAEYEEAMRAAWSAPGITRIEDHITIGSLRGD